MLSDTPRAPRSRRIWIWLIIESILALPAIAIGAMLAVMSPMMFDAPGSDSNPPVILLFFSTVAFPGIFLFSVILAWVAFGMRRNRGALWLSLLPLLPVLTGIAAVAWLQVGSSGSFGR